MINITRAEMAGRSAPANDEACSTPHVAGPLDHKTQCHDFKQSPVTAQDGDGEGTSLLRVLSAKLARLGLSHSAADDESLVIAGQAYDLRSATAMVRQLGRPA